MGSFSYSPHPQTLNFYFHLCNACSYEGTQNVRLAPFLYADSFLGHVGAPPSGDRAQRPLALPHSLEPCPYEKGPAPRRGPNPPTHQ